MIGRKPLPSRKPGPTVPAELCHEFVENGRPELGHQSDHVVVQRHVHDPRDLPSVESPQDFGAGQKMFRLVFRVRTHLPSTGQNPVQKGIQLLGRLHVNELDIGPLSVPQHSTVQEQPVVEEERGDVGLGLVQAPLSRPAPRSLAVLGGGEDVVERAHLADPVLGVQLPPSPFVLPQPLALLRHRHHDAIHFRVGVDRCLQDGGGQLGEAGVVDGSVESRMDGQLAGSPRSFQQGREFRGEIDRRCEDVALHPPPVSVLDQVMDLPLAGSHQIVVTAPQRKIRIPELGSVFEQLPPDHVGGDGKVLFVPEGGGPSLDALVLPLEIGLVSEWVDVHPGELQLGELVDQNPKIGHSPGFTAGSEILEGGMGSNTEDRFHQHVQIGDLEFPLLRRQRVPVGEVTHAPALHQLIDGPQRRPRTAASHHQRRRSFPPGPLQHQALIRDLPETTLSQRLPHRCIRFRTTDQKHRFSVHGGMPARVGLDSVQL